MRVNRKLIKLNIHNMDTITKDHLEEVFGKVKDKYNENKSCKYINLFQDEEGSLDEEFIKTILVKSFQEMKENSKISFLFKLSSLAYNAPTNIKEYIELNCPYESCKTSNYEKIRRNHINSFLNKKKYCGFKIEDYKTKYPNYDKNSEEFEELINDIKCEVDKINSFMKEIFSYNFISSKYRHKLLYDMGVDVCPYCNRQYINSYIYDDDERTTADLDHFYPQKTSAFLGLSLYNFVPSCQICNSRMKSSYFPNIINPIERGYEEEVRFEINIDENDIDIKSIIGESDKFNLKIKINEKSKYKNEIKRSIKLFKLEEIYNTHKKYVSEILVKKHSYTESKKEELKSFFRQAGISEDIDFELLLYGNYTQLEDLGKRPLAKLTRDILK